MIIEEVGCVISTATQASEATMQVLDGGCCYNPVRWKLSTGTLEVVATTHSYLKLEGCLPSEGLRRRILLICPIETNTKRHPFIHARIPHHHIPPPHDRRSHRTNTRPRHAPHLLTLAVLTRYCQVAKCTTIHNDPFFAFLHPSIYYAAINH
jgi:hypothetical protein